MDLSVQLTPGQLKEKAIKYGLSESAFAKLTIHDFGKGTITVTAYPGDDEGQKFLRSLDVPFAIRRQ